MCSPFGIYTAWKARFARINATSLLSISTCQPGLKLTFLNRNWGAVVTILQVSSCVFFVIKINSFLLSERSKTFSVCKIIWLSLNDELNSNSFAF